jgi:hypothetical protein
MFSTKRHGIFISYRTLMKAAAFLADRRLIDIVFLYTLSTKCLSVKLFSTKICGTYYFQFISKYCCIFANRHLVDYFILFVDQMAVGKNVFDQKT